MTASKGIGRGGKREGAGGKLNPLRNARLTALLIEREQRMYGADNRPTPLAFMLNVMWNDKMPFEQRYDAAKAAAPFCHPKLLATQVKQENDNKITIEFKDFASNSKTITSNPVVPLLDSTTDLVDAMITEAEDEAAD
jgi:hypothetical protein